MMDLTLAETTTPRTFQALRIEWLLWHDASFA